MVNSGFRRLINRLTVTLAGLMSGTNEDSMGSRSNQHRILVIGKSGNGRSALCNTLTSSQHFQTGRGLSATTRTVQYHDISKNGYLIRVVDTPDVTNCGMTPQEMEQEVRRWRQITDPYPTAVLLTVRCDVRYTAEEHAIYRQIERLWGDNSLNERLVVAFTFADLQDVPIEQELPTVCPELKRVLKDASNRYILVNNKAPIHEREGYLQQLLNIANRPDMVEGKRRTPNYPSRALFVLSAISGLCFAATFTANKSGPAVGFGMLCLGAGLVALVLRVKEKMP